MRGSYGIATFGRFVGIAVLATAAAPIGAAPPKLTTASKVRDLLANPTTLAVLKADIPQIVANPQLQNGLDMPLEAIAQFEPEALSPANLKKIAADLAKAQP